MPKTKTNTRPAVAITITGGPDDEPIELHFPARPPLSLAQRIRWRLECWQVDFRNVVWWLQGCP